MRTLLQVTLVDMTTIVADGVGDFEREVLSSLLRRYAQKLTILSL